MVLVMSAESDIFKEFMQTDKILANFRVAWSILPAPTQKTMEIVDEGYKINPLSFMLFSMAIFTAVSVIEPQPIVGGKLAFANHFVSTLIMCLSFILYSVVQYKILKGISNTSRSFDKFIAMSATVGGMYYLLVGASLIVANLFETVGGLLALGSVVYMLIYSLRTAKRFWEISIGKILLYSFLSALVATVLLIIIGVILGVLIGLAGFSASTTQYSPNPQYSPNYQYPGYQYQPNYQYSPYRYSR